MRTLIRYFMFAAVALSLGLAGRPAVAVLLTDSGEAKAVIITDDAPNASVTMAVEELNYWLEKIGGTALPVKTFSQWDGQGTFVAIGDSPLAREKGWSKEPFAQEEARVFITDEGIGLLGNDNSPFEGVSWTGSYYAVLEFLQKELGARWIWPGPTGEVFQPQSRIDPQPQEWSWAPDLTLIRRMRNAIYDGGFGNLTLASINENFGIKPDKAAWEALGQQHSQWLRRERMNVSSNVKFGHAFSSWWERFSKDHPDWFSRPPEGLTQRGGHGVKLNLSNPEVADQMFNDWYAAWQEDRLANRYLNVAPNDSRGFDTRPETRAMDAPQMQGLPDKEIYNGADAVLSDRYVKFWNGLARRIAEVDPEARLATYAYRNYREPPLEADLQVEPNTVIAYVGGEGYFPDEPYIKEEWGGWASRGAKLSWRPNLLHSGHGMPYDFSRELFDVFAYLRKNNMLGTDFDSLVGNWYGQGLVYYVVAEQHSRPEATYDELAGEYFAAFGPAEQSVRDFFAYFAERTQEGPDMLRAAGGVARMTWGGWWRGHQGLVSQFLTPEVRAEGRRLLERAQADVANSDAIYRERVDMLNRGFTHAELMAAAFTELKIEDPQVRIDPAHARKALKPLWDYRMEHMTDLAMPAVFYLFLEHRSMKLWDAFVKTADPVSGMQVQAITEGWQLKPDPDNRGRNGQWQLQDPATEGWQPVAIGMPWRKALPQLRQTKIVWYAVNFEVPELDDTGESVLLRFASVDAETRLWVNGVEVDERGYPHRGNYDSWAESFDVNITPVVRGGAKNRLVIRVESDQANGGITGPVLLLVGN